MEYMMKVQVKTQHGCIYDDTWAFGRENIEYAIDKFIESISFWKDTLVSIELSEGNRILIKQ